MLTGEITLIDSVVAWFARDPIGPLLNLPRVASDPPAELANTLEEQLASIPGAVVAFTRDDHHFKSLHSHVAANELERCARIWALSIALGNEIPRRRLEALKQIPPDINTHPALQNLEFDSEGLVAMNEFKIGNGVLIRNGYAFTVALPVQSPNATYWLTLALRSTGARDNARIRLDPFLHGPLDQFETMSYRMLVWGVGSWEDLQTRTGRQNGEWRPGPLTRGVEKTEFAWRTDEHEGHLELEELHQRESNDGRGTRYLHAIFDRRNKCITHVDGATRVLSESAWSQRNDTHLKDLGKIGKRIKIFRIDGHVDESQFAPVCANYFVWNFDIARFFGAEISNEL